MNMGLTKLKGMNCRGISFIIILLSFSSCSWDKCSPIELEMQKLVVEVDSVYSIPLNSLTNFEWTELYVISGPRFPQEVKEITGLEYKEVIKDNSRQIIFIKNNNIIKEYSTSCRNFGWGRLKSKHEGVKLLNSSKIRVRKRLIADEWWLYEAVSSD